MEGPDDVSSSIRTQLDTYVSRLGISHHGGGTAAVHERGPQIQSGNRERLAFCHFFVGNKLILFSFFQNGLVSATPYVGTLIFRFLISFLFEDLLRKTHLSMTVLRKLNVVLGELRTVRREAKPKLMDDFQVHLCQLSCCV